MGSVHSYNITRFHLFQQFVSLQLKSQSISGKDHVIGLWRVGISFKIMLYIADIL